MTADSSAYRLVDRTPELLAIQLFTELAAGSGDVGRFANRIRALPTFAHTYTSHQRAVDPPGNPALLRTLRRLEGKFVVVNRARATSIPQSILDGVLGTHGSSIEHAAQVVVALHEPAAVSVRHTPSDGLRADAQHRVCFSATVPYRITIFVRLPDGKQPDNARAEDERDLILTQDFSESRPFGETYDWFRVGLCVPDGDALRQMTDETALFYRWITGRLGSGSTDRYWYLDEWERYMEEGRIRGIVGPEAMTQPPLPAAHDGNSSISDDEAVYGTGSFSPQPSRWPRLSRHFDRRALVPPGYCLVDFSATLSAHICTVASRPG